MDHADKTPSVPGVDGLSDANSVDLVRGGRGGDAAAVNELFRRYQPRLLRIVRIKMGTFARQHIDPEDIVQEASIVAVANFGTLEVHTSSGILRWLVRIAENVLQNRIRTLKAQKRDPRLEVPIASGAPDSLTGGVVVPAAGPTPSQVFSRQEMEQRIDECVSSMEPEDYRQVLVLRDYCGHSWDEIKEELGRSSVDAARELHRRACEKLRERATRLGLLS